MNHPKDQGVTGLIDDSQDVRESNQSLWLLASGPLIWAGHFLASYVTAAIWCAKFTSRDGSLSPVRWAIGGYTLVALAGIGIVLVIGYRRHGHGKGVGSPDFDTPHDRHRFLGFSTVLLSSLSAVATVFVALVALFMETCH